MLMSFFSHVVKDLWKEGGNVDGVSWFSGDAEWSDRTEGNPVLQPDALKTLWVSE